MNVHINPDLNPEAVLIYTRCINSFKGAKSSQENLLLLLFQPENLLFIKKGKKKSSLFLVFVCFYFTPTTGNCLSQQKNVFSAAQLILTAPWEIKSF